MDERARRIGANEAVFREVNERLRDLNDAFGELSGLMNIICECGRGGCTERIDIPPEAYRAVRAEPRKFVIVPRHEFPEVENVVERSERFWIVEKLEGGPAEIAEETAPDA